ncbi:MmcQ/YjbR family DNA-binding protein [Agaribacterium haliotis]|uniref:MmcQ/YjbR family DNA-binding protein n=1 Tax=Agaribacterium haliotis TaxID=2013869 RepID=UPI000BB5342F|nr:MmcQ/YjbR family DNA-binding protein [Agaribacterium haliotis]
MTYDEFNKFCSSFAGSSYVVQWGGAHVWKVCDKVFAIGGWEKQEQEQEKAQPASKKSQPAFSFKTSENNFNILKDEAGYRPAPYMASRGMKWIQLYLSSAHNDSELKAYIEDSYLLVAKGLSKKRQREIGLLEPIDKKTSSKA